MMAFSFQAFLHCAIVLCASPWNELREGDLVFPRGFVSCPLLNGP